MDVLKVSAKSNPNSVAGALAGVLRERGNAEGNLLLGFGVALLIVYMHSMYEWVIFAKEVQYLLFTTMGMIFGISLRMAAMRQPAKAGSGAGRKPAAGNAQGETAPEGAW